MAKCITNWHFCHLKREISRCCDVNFWYSQCCLLFLWHFIYCHLQTQTPQVTVTAIIPMYFCTGCNVHFCKNAVIFCFSCSVDVSVCWPLCCHVAEQSRLQWTCTEPSNESVKSHGSDVRFMQGIWGAVFIKCNILLCKYRKRSRLHKYPITEVSMLLVSSWRSDNWNSKTEFLICN